MDVHARAHTHAHIAAYSSTHCALARVPAFVGMCVCGGVWLGGWVRLYIYIHMYVCMDIYILGGPGQDI